MGAVVAASSAVPLAIACGGKEMSQGGTAPNGDPSSSNGSSGGRAPGQSPPSRGNDPTPQQEPNSPSCTFETKTSPVDVTACKPQLASVQTCGSVCAWNVETPCAPDGGPPDAGNGYVPPDVCHALCDDLAPPGASLTGFCHVIAKDGGASTVMCGGCGVGRPPRGFAARPAGAPSVVGERLARLAQLEIASVYAFCMLYDDLVRHSAPPAMLRDVERFARDEARHGWAMRCAAGRYGAIVPPVEIAPRMNARTLEDLAIDNAEEGCVAETFGAALAHVQARDASDPEFSIAMRTIAEEETRHAALSWQLDEWLASQLDDDARARVRAAHERAWARLEAEIAGEDALSELGLPNADGLRALLASVRGSIAAAA